VVDEPPEDVADATLAGLVAPEPGDDAAIDDAAHARHVVQRVAVHHVAGRGAHDRDHLAGFDRSCCRRSDMGVDVADGDCDALGEPGPGGGLIGEGPCEAAELADRVGDLVVDHSGEVGVEFGEELTARVLAVLEDALVAGSACVADVGAAQLPHDPVGGLDPPFGGVVHLWVLFEQLERLSELPLRRDQPPVACDPRLPTPMCGFVDAIGVRLGGVVLPELDVGVRPICELGELAQRRAVRRCRHHRARREVGGDPDHVCRVDAGCRDCRGYCDLQHLDVVGRSLQRPVGRQSSVVTGRQRPIHDGMRVLVRRAADLCSVADPNNQHPARQRAEVDADHVRRAAGHHVHAENFGG
jgi:hypothetical protein